MGGWVGGWVGRYVQDGEGLVIVYSSSIQGTGEGAGHEFG